jgi:hypothetical protein
MNRERRGSNLLQRQRDARQAQQPRLPLAQPQSPAAPVSGPASVANLGTFARNNISTASTSKGQIDRANGAGNVTLGIRLPPATCMTGGWVFAVTAQLTGATGGTHWEAEVYVNGAATGIIYRVAGTTVTEIPGRYPLRPGDVVSVYDLRSGALNNVTALVEVWGRLEAGPAGSGV